MPYNDNQEYDRDSTNILRASVLDVFRELGALEDESVVKAWILDGPESKATAPSLHSSIRDIDSPESSPRVNFTPQDGHNHGEADSEDSGDETDTGERRTRNVFRNVISFRLRSKSRTRGTKSRARGRSPSSPANNNTSGYETDEGYTSASSAKTRKVLKKRRASTDGEDPPEVPPLPPQSPTDRGTTTGSGTLSKLFRTGYHSRRPSKDASTLLPPPASRVGSAEIPTPLSMPSPTTRKRGGTRSSEDTVVGEPSPSLAKIESPKKQEGSTSRLSFAIPANTVPRLRGSRSALNLKKLKGTIKTASTAAEVVGSKSVPSSPFLLVAPYGQEDSLVHLGSPHILAESIDTSTKGHGRKPVASLSRSAVPVSISKTHSHLTDAAEKEGEATQGRRLSLDSSIQRMQKTTGRPDFGQGATINLPMRSVLGRPPMSPLIPPPRLTNPDASRFAEMDLD